MTWIDAQDLAKWADTPECAVLLPMLVRKLIVATTPGISLLNVPSGSSVRLKGWDGKIETSQGTAFVPAGKSAWEMSSEKDQKSKATGDFKKRSTKPGSISPSETTFIFVTPRVWSGKENWILDASKDSKWQGIQVYDATILAQWLELVPSVSSWLARKIKKLPPSGYLDLDTFWKDWSTQTQPPLSHGLIITGRDESKKLLEERLQDKANHFYIQGETKDEAVAFLAACAIDSETSWGADLFAKAIIVENSTTWQQLVTCPTPLILIPVFVGSFSAQVAVDTGHHVVIPLEKKQPVKGAGTTLPRPNRDGFVNALIEMGITEEKARAFMQTTGRNLSVLRRRLINQAGGKRPDWAEASTAKLLIPALLLTQWTESENDLAALAEIAGRSAADVLRDYQILLNQPDAPIRKVGAAWRLTSHEESWELLASYLTTDDLARFTAVVQKALSEVSPAFDLEKNERYWAPIKGKTLTYTQDLREGLSHSLGIMGSRPEPSGSELVKKIANTAVRGILKQTHDWKLWGTIGGLLPNLAEAAPEVVLDALEETLDHNPNALLELFKQEGDGMFGGGCLHANLLWALERMAWCDDFLSRVSLVLARLSLLDPGGRYRNRPTESLRALFLGWKHYTSTIDADRLKILDLLLQKYPDAGWSLLIAICPDTHESISGRTKPQWRPWGQDVQDTVSRKDFISYIQEVLEKVLREVGTSPKRWVDVLEKFPSFPPEVRLKTIERLEAATGSPTAEWNIVWSKLRGILNQHLSYPDTDWALPAAETTRIQEIYKRMTPANLYERYGWVFVHWPRLPEAGKIGDEDSIIRAREIQNESVRSIFEQSGVSGLRELSLLVEAPDVVARATVSIVTDETVLNDMILDFLASPERKLNLFGICACEQLFKSNSWAALEALLKDAKTKKLSANVQSKIYLSAKSTGETWQRLEKEDPAAQSEYWAHISPYSFRSESPEDLDYGMKHLLSAGRPLEVLDALAYEKTPISSDILIRALEMAPEKLNEAARNKKPFHADAHDIARIFAKLDGAPGVTRDQIAKLEIPFVSVLRFERPVLALHKQVLEEPSTFGDLICWAFKPSDDRTENDEIGAEERTKRAEFAFAVLYGLPQIPGQQDDGKIDGEKLKLFTKDAVKICAERGRAAVGEQLIGQVLANAPEGPDGIWPCEEVRDALENLNTKDIGIGFTMGKHNSRGVVSKGAYEGGDQENKLAEKFRVDAKKVKASWPFTAKVLNSLADEYAYRAKEEDETAELRDL